MTPLQETAQAAIQLQTKYPLPSPFIEGTYHWEDIQGAIDKIGAANGRLCDEFLSGVEPAVTMVWKACLPAARWNIILQVIEHVHRDDRLNMHKSTALYDLLKTMQNTQDDVFWESWEGLPADVSLLLSKWLLILADYYRQRQMFETAQQNIDALRNGEVAKSIIYL